MKLKPVVVVPGTPVALKPDEFNIRVETGVFKFRMGCPNGERQCEVGITVGDEDHARGLHGWDGNEEEPTLKPSINCDQHPRCGWHGTVVKGERLP